MALELYSGIGGFHYAFQGSRMEDVLGEVCAAADINTTANQTYIHNFPNTKLLQRNIESFTVEDIEKLNVDFIWMSPPCQPFTRTGKQQDCSDSRTCSFLHLISIIPHLTKKPKYILLENVKGFETSQARSQLITMLQLANYTYQEFLLSPQMIGIPNSRLRYYIVAKLKPLDFPFQISAEVMCALPPTNDVLDVGQKPTLNDYLEQDSASYFEEFLLPDRVLLKCSCIFDIVDRHDTHSCCFTKAYSHFGKGAGSVIRTNHEVSVQDVYAAIDGLSENDPEKLRLLKTLKLRYFTPREVANLLGFPSTFSFPPYFSSRQKYRLLGNSINIDVVKRLLDLCFDL